LVFQRNVLKPGKSIGKSMTKNSVAWNFIVVEFRFLYNKSYYRYDLITAETWGGCFSSSIFVLGWKEQWQLVASISWSDPAGIWSIFLQKVVQNMARRRQMTSGLIRWRKFSSTESQISFCSNEYVEQEKIIFGQCRMTYSQKNTKLHIVQRLSHWIFWPMRPTDWLPQDYVTFNPVPKDHLVP